MARAYMVKGPEGALRIAGSVAHARELRDELVDRLDCKKKDVDIEDQIELPTKKDELIAFLNGILADFDLIEEPSEEEEE